MYPYYLTSTLGYTISYSTVKNIVRDLTDKAQEAYIRQEYQPGQACEFDWGEVKLDIGGTGYHKYQMAAFASSDSVTRTAATRNRMLSGQ